MSFQQTEDDVYMLYSKELQNIDYGKQTTLYTLSFFVASRIRYIAVSTGVYIPEL